MTPSINFSGINSGLDSSAIIDALMDIERMGLNRLNTRKNLLLARQATYRDLDTELTSLREVASVLSDRDALMANKATPADDSLLTATAGADAMQGTHHVTILQKATVSELKGQSDAGSGINKNVALNHADAFGASFREGSFTVNGVKIDVAETDTLQDVLDDIKSAMGGGSEFVANYNAGSDKVVLRFKDSGDGPLVLGSAADTSNLLELLKLHADGTSHRATSESELGGLDITATINDGGANAARSRTAITDGGAGAGSFEINHVAISFDASVDSISDVMTRINQSEAGVLAHFDPYLDRIVLANKNGGSIGISAQDVTGNFVSALGLDGAVDVGQNAEVRIDGINGDQPIISADNLFTEAETGIAGLSFTVKADSGSTDIDISTDAEAMTSRVQDFVDAYNKTVTLIEDRTKVSGTGDDMTVGILHGEQGVLILARTMRSTLASSVPGISGAPSTLAGMGVSTTGVSPTLTLDVAKLTEAIQSNPDAFKTVFADPDNGAITKLVSYIDSQTRFGEGPLAEKSETIEPSIQRLNDSIERFERNLDLTEQRLFAKFQAMERAMGQLQGGVSTILAGLQTPPRFGGGNS